MSGFGRKPKWADERTPQVAEVNVWRAKQLHISQAGKSGLTETRSRKFAHEWNLSIQGHKSKQSKTPSLAKLSSSIARRKKEKKESEEK